jgi:hypothetical protein
MLTNDDCPVCNGRKIILTRDYADRERDEPCPHCSEHEHCASCLAVRTENARLREAVERAWDSLQTYLAPEYDTDSGCNYARRNVAQRVVVHLTAALKEPGDPKS